MLKIFKFKCQKWAFFLISPLLLFVWTVLNDQKCSKLYMFVPEWLKLIAKFIELDGVLSSIPYKESHRQYLSKITLFYQNIKCG